MTPKLPRIGSASQSRWGSGKIPQRVNHPLNPPYTVVSQDFSRLIICLRGYCSKTQDRFGNSIRNSSTCPNAPDRDLPHDLHRNRTNIALPFPVSDLQICPAAGAEVPQKAQAMDVEFENESQDAIRGQT